MSNIQFVEEEAQVTRIKVIGVGGGGCNAVDSMIDMGLRGVEFFNINTDQQALNLSKCENKLHIGDEVTSGMGCGGDPSLGEKAAMASKDQISEALNNCEMIFIAAGMGGGTGTGAAPVVAEIAKTMGLLTVAIVTKPFAFEGPQRFRRAEMGLKKLSEFVDTKIVILNDKLIDIIGPKTPLTEAFHVVNRVLAEGVQAISDLISVPGAINVDFMDIRTIMGETGGAVMGVGHGKGENRASEAVKKACASPLQEKIVIEGARGVLISISASDDVSLQEVNLATSMVYEMADPEANIIFGLVIDPDMKDDLRVTIIATGFPDEERRFPGKMQAQENLSSPQGLDLETKIKSMMQGEEEAEEMGEMEEPEDYGQPENQTPEAAPKAPPKAAPRPQSPTEQSDAPPANRPAAPPRSGPRPRPLFRKPHRQAPAPGEAKPEAVKKPEPEMRKAPAFEKQEMEIDEELPDLEMWEEEEDDTPEKLTGQMAPMDPDDDMPNNEKSDNPLDTPAFLRRSSRKLFE